MKIIQENSTTPLWCALALSILESEYEEIECTLILKDIEKGKPPLFVKDGRIELDVYRNYNADFNKPIFQSTSRMRNSIIKSKPIGEEYKMLLDLLIAIAHEVGHILCDHSPHKMDMKRYDSDLEYRLKIENDAEKESTKLAKKYGFLDFINDIS